MCSCIYWFSDMEGRYIAARVHDMRILKSNKIRSMNHIMENTCVDYNFKRMELIYDWKRTRYNTIILNDLRVQWLQNYIYFNLHAKCLKELKMHLNSLLGLITQKIQYSFWNKKHHNNSNLRRKRMQRVRLNMKRRQCKESI